jgi:multiple sugar transport system substrate-binding protein
MTRLGALVHYGSALLAVLALAGCRGDAGAAHQVRLWAMGREGEVVQQLLPAFAARHPEVRVRVQQIPWSAAHEKLLTAFVGGTMPDVFQLGSTWVPELTAIGAMEALDDRLARSASARSEDEFPGIRDANRIDGTTYAVPWYVDTRLLFYRADLLAQAGLAAPPADWAAWQDRKSVVQGKSVG